LLAEELRIPILLIAQPRKLDGKTSRLTTSDLRDTSSIGQDADTVILLHRDKLPLSRDRPEVVGNLYSPKTEVIVETTRWNPGGITTLHFASDISRFFNSQQEELEYRNKFSAVKYAK
jgi:replicative DNA helicase